MPGKSAPTFGRILRKRRRAKGLSQEELASVAGVHRTFVSMLERGVRTPSLDVVLKLANGLDTTATSLVEDLDRAMSQGRD